MKVDDDVADERRRLLALVGIGGAVLTALLGIFAPHPASLFNAPRQLQALAERALVSSDLPGLEVVFDGQRVRLRGVVADEQDIVAASRAALAAAGQGGQWAGGVTSVDASALSVGAFEQPFAWSARREGERLALTGAAPSAETQSELMALAREHFVAPSDSTHVAGGAPSPRFGAMAQQAVRALARLNSGEARIVGDRVVIIGDGGQAAVDAVRREFAAPPAPFHVRLELTVDGLDPSRPELQGLNLASGEPEDCAEGFARVMEHNVINFATGSAAIDPSSREVLNTLASVALRCDRFTIEVAGHTDNQGNHAANMALSRQRADAVADYLVTQNVARERLTARGYGPERPRASNSDEAGRAANRRIEFNVSR